MKTFLNRIIITLALACSAAPTLLAQGPLTPPGPPGPLMKTLDQVEPRTPIGTLPFTISSPGSYYLTTNLNAGGGNGITIAAGDVTLDLMGFEISEGAGSGITVAGALPNLTVRNGTLRRWSDWGIDAEQSRRALIENVRFADNGQTPDSGGLRVGGESVVRHCAAGGNVGPGIQVAGERGRIEANHLTLNGTGLHVTKKFNIIILNSASGNTLDYDVTPGNDLGPIGAAATLASPWGNIGALPPVLHDLTVTLAGNGTGTVTSSPSGINCPIDCVESHLDGTVVTLTATPSAGSIFAGWSGGGCSGTGPCVTTLSAATTVTATFSLMTHVLTVVRTGTGSGTVTSSPAGINCGADCTEPFANGSLVTLTPTPAAGSTFAGWSGGGCSGISPCTLTLNAATTVTATFNTVNHTLTVTRAGTGTGTVTSAPAGINCGADCTEALPTGTMVTLTATPAGGSTFSGWSGGGCTGTGTCTVTMNAATSVTATFSSANSTLTVAKAGTGVGTVTSSPAGINCGADCTESVANGTMFTLTAAPAAGSTFVGWSGGGCSGTGTCTATINSPTTVTAMFNLNSYAVTVTKTGTATGTVTSSPAGINCGATCTQNFNHGTTVTFTASPSAGATFLGWGGACTGISPCTVTVTAPLNVTATFGPL